MQRPFPRDTASLHTPPHPRGWQDQGPPPELFVSCGSGDVRQILRGGFRWEDIALSFVIIPRAGCGLTNIFAELITDKGRADTKVSNGNVARNPRGVVASNDNGSCIEQPKALETTDWSMTDLMTLCLHISLPVKQKAQKVSLVCFNASLASFLSPT
jgi:hypothetical protein